MSELAYFDRLEAVIGCMLEEWDEVSLYDEIFEDENPETASKIKKANELSEKSQSCIMKAIATIKNLFKRITEAIGNAFEYFFAGKDEKIKYEDFLKDLSSDPDLAGKKVTFHDYRDIISKMDNDCKKWEADYTKFKESAAEENPSLEKTIKKQVEEYGPMIQGVVAGEGASFTVEMAIEYAKQSRAHARQVQKWIQYDMAFISAIEGELAEKDKRKFKKTIKKLNSELRIVRFIAGGREREGKTLEDAKKSVEASLMKLWRVHRRAKRGKHGDQVKASEKHITRLAMNSIRNGKAYDGELLADAKVKHLTNKANNAGEDWDSQVQKYERKKYKKMAKNLVKETEKDMKKAEKN